MSNNFIQPHAIPCGVCNMESPLLFVDAKSMLESGVSTLPFQRGEYCTLTSFEVLTNAHNDCQNHFMNQSQKQDETTRSFSFSFSSLPINSDLCGASNQKGQTVWVVLLSTSSPRIWGILISGQKYKAMDWLIAAGEGKGVPTLHHISMSGTMGKMCKIVPWNIDQDPFAVS